MTTRRRNVALTRQRSERRERRGSPRRRKTTKLQVGCDNPSTNQEVDYLRLGWARVSRGRTERDFPVGFPSRRALLHDRRAVSRLHSSYGLFAFSLVFYFERERAFGAKGAPFRAPSSLMSGTLTRLFCYLQGTPTLTGR